MPKEEWITQEEKSTLSLLRFNVVSTILTDQVCEKSSGIKDSNDPREELTMGEGRTGQVSKGQYLSERLTWGGLDMGYNAAKARNTYKPNLLGKLVMEASND